MFIFERERERARKRGVGGGGEETETQNLKQAPGTEPDAGLKPTNLEIMT